MIKILSFLSDQGLSGLSVGLVAGAAHVERVAEGFQGRFDMCPILDADKAVGARGELLFTQCESQQEVEVLVLDPDEQLPDHQIIISVAASSFPAFDSVVYTVLAPSFAPGGIGVDWEDVRSILRLGNRAVLVMSESDESVAETLRLAQSILASVDCPQISGVMPVVFAPQGTPWVEAVRQLGSAAETLAPDAWRLVAAPVILGDTPVCSLLIVLTE